MFNMRHLQPIVLLCVAISGAAQAQDRVHADLPLFTHKDEELSPRNFHDVQGDELSFGCIHRVKVGDWKYVERPDQGGRVEERWLRLHNYGAFHCASYERWAYEKSRLEHAEAQPAWFVELGSLKVDGVELELWALQGGSSPGSNYLLLSRRPEKEVAKKFDVLQVKCPARFLRKGQPIDIWRVDYCVINDRAQLRAFARTMAKLPPAGTLTFESETPAAEE